MSDMKAAVEEVAQAPFSGVQALVVGLNVASAKAKAKYGDRLDDDTVPEPLAEFLDWLLEAAEEYIETSFSAWGIE